jgi:hypothetical protein
MKMTSATTPTTTPNKFQAKGEDLFDGFEDMKIRIVVMTLTRRRTGVTKALNSPQK